MDITSYPSGTWGKIKFALRVLIFAACLSVALVLVAPMLLFSGATGVSPLLAKSHCDKPCSYSLLRLLSYILGYTY